MILFSFQKHYELGDVMIKISYFTSFLDLEPNVMNSLGFKSLEQY